MTNALQHTPLYDLHVERGARLVEFAGWSMPISYVGIVEEHVHTRTACSIFDVSHMGRLMLVGRDAEAFLNRVCTRNLAGADVGRCFYSHVCRDDGGILDDVIVSRFEDHWGVVCNASNRQKILAWFETQRRGTDVTVRDETTATAMLAVQGPRALDLAVQLGGGDLADLKRYHLRTYPLLGASLVVYRTGYTGEDGFEVVLPAGMVAALIPRLLGTREQPHPFARPAGLGARDTLRIEAAMPLYGHELGEEVDSLTAGQAWCVDLQKDFIGSLVLRQIQAEGLRRRLVGLELAGRRIARQHYPVLAGSRTVGEVTSGTLSPTLGKSIAMVFVEADHASEGSCLEVDMKGRREPAKVVKLPFYRRPRPA